MIARAADFYGPESRNGLPNVLVFGPFAKNQKASCLANDSVPHSYTYTLDAARSLVALAESESAWNQTWHVATTSNPPTGKEFIAKAAKEFGVAPRYRVLSRPMVRVMEWFNPLVGEVYEMLYQNDSPYLFDSSKFERAFRFSCTPYVEGIRSTAASFQKVASSAE
jgi:nucleoside-diphosphate-sugar epimerase